MCAASLREARLTSPRRGRARYGSPGSPPPGDPHGVAAGRPPVADRVASGVVEPAAVPPPEEYPEVPADRASRDPWWTFGYRTLGPLFHLLFKIRYRGRSNMPPEGGMILVSNHISVLDP